MSEAELDDTDAVVRRRLLVFVLSISSSSKFPTRTRGRKSSRGQQKKGKNNFSLLPFLLPCPVAPAAKM